AGGRKPSRLGSPGTMPGWRRIRIAAARRCEAFSPAQRQHEGWKNLMLDPDYPRDLEGYGKHPPHAAWPGGARIAVQFVLNVEEGGEHCVLHGDTHSEAHLSESVAVPLEGRRNLIVESFYEYGARAGFWRIMRLFEKHAMPFTSFAVGMALR